MICVLAELIKKMIFCLTYSAVTELETALSCYKSLSPAPIWAVAENYRFEPAFVEVLVFVVFDW